MPKSKILKQHTVQPSHMQVMMEEELLYVEPMV